MNSNKNSLLSLTLTLFCFFLFTIPAFAESSGDNKLFKDPKSAMHAYKKGIDAIMDKIPDNLQDQKNPLFVLSVFKSSAYQRLAWGKIQSNNAMVALESGNNGGFWVLFIENDHPSLQDKFETMMTKKGSGLVYTQVRPDLMSSRWAGVFLVHEFSNAYGLLYDRLAPPEVSAFNAARFEREAYELISSGKFFQVLDQVIDETKLTDHEKYKAFLSGGPKNLSTLLTLLDKMLEEKAPLSRAEGEMRYAFYTLSMSIRISEKTGANRDTAVANLSDIRKQVNKY